MGLNPLSKKDRFSMKITTAENISLLEGSNQIFLDVSATQPAFIKIDI